MHCVLRPGHAADTTSAVLLFIVAAWRVPVVTVELAEPGIRKGACMHACMRVFVLLFCRLFDYLFDYLFAFCFVFA
jgi:hypothetical protein